MNKKEILISGSCLYKNYAGKTLWFIIKSDEESDWGLPKTNVRRGESSVRTAIRSAAERGAMKVTVLEEVGRFGGATVVSGKTLSLKTIFYLMNLKGFEGEAIGYFEEAWLEYTKAAKKLVAKRDQNILKSANKLLAEIEKQKSKKRS